MRRRLRLPPSAVRAAASLFGFRQERSYGLFFLLLLLHLIFKASLGLSLTFDAGYGLSLVTPPATIVVAGTDVVNLLLLVKALDIAVPAAALPAVHAVFIAADLLFLATCHVVFHYFGTYLTWGLIRFNGADAVELASCLPRAMTPWFLLFLLASATVLALAPAVAARLRGRVRSLPRAVAAVLFLGLAAIAANRAWLKSEHVGNLYGNPEYNLLQTTLAGITATAGAVDPAFSPRSRRFSAAIRRARTSSVLTAVDST